MSRRALLVLAAFLLGALLRLWNLGPQVMSDDELHAVRTALGNPVSQILVTYRRVDNTIPLTAIFRVLLDLGVRLTEWTVRLPAVVSGLLLLAVAPLWAARRLGWPTAAVFAFLLAVSPGLVFYSRIARSYAPIVLLGFGALAAFEAWWRRLAALSVTAVLGHIAGLLYLAPQGHEHPLISFRYVLVVLPWVLLWVAVTFEAGRRPLTPLVAAFFLLLLLLVWAGPFVNPRLWRSPFAHHNDYMTLMWHLPGLAPRQVPEGFLASRARWLVVHRNLAQEESRIPPPGQIEAKLRNLFRVFGRRMTAQLTRDWGKPDYLDRRIAVWDLDRVRR